MKPSRVAWEEILAVVGSLVVAVAVFLAWYKLDNQFARIGRYNRQGEEVSGWHALTIMRYLILLCAIAPLVLTWVSLRNHELSWPRGEVTTVIGLLAFILILTRGLIIRPGEPPHQISLAYGYWIALGGALLMTVCAALTRAARDDTPPKPPGEL